MSVPRLLPLAVLVLFAAPVSAVAQQVDFSGSAAGTVDDGRGTPYEFDKSDNICGLDDAKQLSNPAKVDYKKLLTATPELRKMKKERITKDSAEGIQLMNKAESRVRDACDAVMGKKGHCSVWKDIKRRDGKAIKDITALVKDRMSKQVK